MADRSDQPSYWPYFVLLGLVAVVALLTFFALGGSIGGAEQARGGVVIEAAGK